MRRNRLRDLLRRGSPTIGTHLHTLVPSLVEILGHAGTFDYVEFLGEFAPYDLHTLEHLARAVDLFDHMTSMMKIDQQPRTFLAARAIGAGIQNVLFSDVRTVANVEECVRAVRAESPEWRGLHGAGLRRDVGYVLEPGSAAFVQALEDAVVAINVEKKEAVENLGALLAVKGVDMVQFGPADYAISVGLAGQRDHPQVRAAEEYVIDTALRKGIAYRAEINHVHEAERYLDLGVRHLCIGTDIRILYWWWKENGDALRQLLLRT